MKRIDPLFGFFEHADTETFGEGSLQIEASDHAQVGSRPCRLDNHLCVPAGSDYYQFFHQVTPTEFFLKSNCFLKSRFAV